MWSRDAHKKVAKTCFKYEAMNIIWTVYTQTLMLNNDLCAYQPLWVGMRDPFF